MNVKLGLKNLAMFSSSSDYIFVHLRQKALLRPELSPKFLSTLGPNPARTRHKPNPTRPENPAGLRTLFWSSLKNKSTHKNRRTMPFSNRLDLPTWLCTFHSFTDHIDRIHESGIRIAVHCYNSADILTIEQIFLQFLHASWCRHNSDSTRFAHFNDSLSLNTILNDQKLKNCCRKYSNYKRIFWQIYRSF